MINYIIYKNEEIDKVRWDKYIGSTHNPRVYALSWYLDIVSPGWQALIFGDWNCVVPLPCKVKYGLKYLIQPLFCQQLGVFSSDKLTTSMIDDVLSVLKSHFCFLSYSFSTNTPIFEGASTRVSYELALAGDYDSLRKNFSSGHKKNITKSLRHGTVVERSNDYQPMVDLLRKMYEVKNVDGVKEFHYQMLNDIFKYAVENNSASLYFARNVEGDIIGGAFFLRYLRRHVIFSARINEGFSKRVGFLLVDAFLKDYAGSGDILDFAGSDMKGIAEFNEGWGSQKLEYPVCKNIWFKAFEYFKNISFNKV